jgi:protein-arginine kinase
MRRKQSELTTTVISTRMRLARNLQAYPFPARLQQGQAEEIVILTRNALARLDSGWKEYDVRAIGKA